MELRRPIPVEHHPTARKYVEIALILGVLTALEVAVYYISILRELRLMAPILISVSALKFALVVMFYMHLKFDPRLFSWLFIAGLCVGAFILFTLMALFGYFVRQVPAEQRGPTRPKVETAVQAKAGGKAAGKVAAPVDPTSIGDPAKGRELFVSKGCVACHMAPGVESTATIGPNQAGFAQRPALPGALPNTPEILARWLKNPPAVKPGTLMPNLNLSDEEIKNLSAFLYSLK